MFGNPELKNGKFGNDLYKKIDFEPFDTSGAGVRGKMKARLAEIMRTYEISPGRENLRATRMDA